MKKQIQLLFVLIPVLLFTGCPYQAVIPYEEVEKYIEPMIRLTGSYNTEYREIAKFVILESELTLEDGADIYVGATNNLEFDTSKVFDYNEITFIELLPGSSARFRLGPLPTVNSEPSNITSHINLVSKNIRIRDEADFILGSAGSIEIGEGMRIDAGSDFFAYTTMGYEIQLKDIDSTTVWDATKPDTTYYTLLEWSSTIFEEAEIDGEMKIEIVSETENKIVYSKMTMISDKRESISLPSDLMQDYYRIMLRSKDLEHTPSKAVMNGADGIIFGCSDPFLIDTPNKYEYINFTSTKRNYTRKYNSSTKSFEELSLGPKIRNPDKKTVYYTIDGSDPRNSSTSKNSDSYEFEVYIGNADRTEIRAVVKIKEAWGQEIKGTWTITDGEITQTDPDPGFEVIKPPQFGIRQGVFDKPQEISLYTVTLGAEILYTLNGRDPMENVLDAKTYTKPFKLNSDQSHIEITARAKKDGEYSELVYRWFDYDPAYDPGYDPVCTPTLGENSSFYLPGDTVTLKCGTSGANIYYKIYKTSESDNSTNYQLYTSNGITLSENGNFFIRTYATHSGMYDSPTTNIMVKVGNSSNPALPDNLNSLTVDLSIPDATNKNFFPTDGTSSSSFTVNVRGVGGTLPDNSRLKILGLHDFNGNIDLGGDNNVRKNKGTAEIKLSVSGKYLMSFELNTNSSTYDIVGYNNSYFNSITGDLLEDYRFFVSQNGDLSFFEGTGLYRNFTLSVDTASGGTIFPGDDFGLQIASNIDDSVRGIVDESDFFALYDKLLLDKANTYCNNADGINDWTDRLGNTITDALAYVYGGKDSISIFNTELDEQREAIQDYWTEEDPNHAWANWNGPDGIPGNEDDTRAPADTWSNYRDTSYRPVGKPVDVNTSSNYAGIDCAGFVQRNSLHRNVFGGNENAWDNRADYGDGGGWTAYSNPSGIRATTFETSNAYTFGIDDDNLVVPGDILASDTHVVIVDKVVFTEGTRTVNKIHTLIIEATAFGYKIRNDRNWQNDFDDYTLRRIKP